MTDVRLSTTSYVVLGVIALRGPSTPYALKRAVEHSVDHFWLLPHAQLYAEPDRLAELGLLARSVEGSGRRRKTYSLTAPGRDVLLTWLAAPTDDPFQIRDIAALKLFFHEVADPGNVPALAAEQIRLHRRRIAVYDDMVARFGGHDAPPRMVTLELGLEMEHAALRFWTALADDDLDGLRAGRSRPE